MRISILTEAEATAQQAAIQADYEAKEIDGTVNAVMGQIDRFFVTTIPAARVAEFNLSDATKQNNFAIITANAYGTEYQGVEFLTAWEAEYAKIYP